MASYLSRDISVGNSDNQSILWCIVLVFLLDNQALSGIVVSLSLCKIKKQKIKIRLELSISVFMTRGLTSAPLELDLETFEVSLILDHFYKSLMMTKKEQNERTAILKSTLRSGKLTIFYFCPIEKSKSKAKNGWKGESSWSKMEEKTA